MQVLINTFVVMIAKKACALGPPCNVRTLIRNCPKTYYYIRLNKSDGEWVAGIKKMHAI